MSDYSYEELKKRIDAAKGRRANYILIFSIEKLNNKVLKKLQKEGYNVDFISNTTLTPFKPKPFFCKISWEREVVIISPRFATASYT